MSDHADHLLPGRDLLGIQLTRQLLQQVELMRPCIQQKPAPGQVKDLWFARDGYGEEGVALRGESFAQGRRRLGEERFQLEALELAAGMEELPCSEVAVEHTARIAGQNQRQG